MPLIGFTKFIPKVLLGLAVGWTEGKSPDWQWRFHQDAWFPTAKLQTIRAKRKHPIKTGDTLIIATGVRTKHYRRLGTAVCREVRRVNIWKENVVWVDVGGDKPWLISGNDELQRFARLDGFECWLDMMRFFKPERNVPFDGDLIVW